MTLVCCPFSTCKRPFKKKDHCKQHLCRRLANGDEFHPRNDPFWQDSTVVRILEKPTRKLQKDYDRKYHEKNKATINSKKRESYNRKSFSSARSPSSNRPHKVGLSDLPPLAIFHISEENQWCCRIRVR